LIGYVGGTFPTTAQTTAQSFTGTVSPEINVISDLIIRCNLIDNPYSIVPDVLGFVGVNSANGEVNTTDATTNAYLTIAPNSYKQIKITLVSQDYAPLIIKDTQTSMLLTLQLSQT
jgi:hypothetical protein